MSNILSYCLVSIVTTFSLSLLGTHTDSERNYGTRFPYDSSTFKNIAGTPLNRAIYPVSDSRDFSRDKREGLPPKALGILEQYYLDQLDPDDPVLSPHPTEQEKEQLLYEMNYIITLTQLNNWFVNTRRRNHEKWLKVKMVSHNSNIKSNY